MFYLGLKRNIGRNRTEMFTKPIRNNQQEQQLP